jgi:hypothetical protein
MDTLRFTPRTSVTDVVDDTGHRQFLATCSTGIAFVPEPIGDQDVLGLKADYGDFSKWLAAEHPRLVVTVPPDTSKIILHNADIWLPLVYLAADTSIQVFLNMVASYLYERAKGALKNEQPGRVHLSAEYQDWRAGKTKRLEFSGDSDALAKVIKRFDLKNFFDET